MEKIAVFPGSFDPFTIGHESIIRRGLSLFDKIVIMLGVNSSKVTFFTQDSRKKMIEDLFDDEPRVTVKIHEGLTIDFCKEINATHILRGLRTSADFEFERAIAQVNKKMYENVETCFLLTIPEHTPVNSSVVRDILRHGGNADMFIPNKININHYKRN